MNREKTGTTLPLTATIGDIFVKTDAAAGGKIYVATATDTYEQQGGIASGSVTSVAQSFTGGLISVGGSPITTSGTLALTVAGTSGGIPYFSSSSAWASSAALAANQLVLGGGAGVAPATLGSLGTATTVLHGNASGAPTFSAVSLSADVTGNLPVGNLNSGTSASASTFWRGDGTWAVAGAGSVTSVAQSFTGGLISVAGSPITTSGTLALTVAGTSGGIPYFDSATSWASSGALTANRIILGGGAGAAPTALGSLGTTTTVLHGNAAGAPTFGAVSLTADVTGNLPVTNLNSGTSASASTFWRGDGSWATPAGAMAIGGTVTSGTTQSVLFVTGGSPVLAQDNTNFTFNADTSYPTLAVGQSTTPIVNGAGGRLRLLANSTGNQASDQPYPGLVMKNGSTASSSIVDVRVYTNGTGTIAGWATDGLNTIGYGAGAGTYFGTYSSHALGFMTNNTLRFSISNAGALTNHVSGNETTGAGSAALGANSPAVTNTAPYKWLKITTQDGSQGYIPVWK